MALNVGDRLGHYDVAVLIGRGRDGAGTPRPNQLGPLEPGSTLGPYQIEGPLGAGGMGEVYKARDTRLDRTVAIKVLPEHVADDADLKQRFEREARTISRLNHPHICTLYDIGNQVPTDPSAGSGSTGPREPIDFLVMEFIEGETLAQRLEKGAVPLDQALQIAIEISDALDKAHRQGIVHRDLKPGNIMLTKAGAARPGSPQAKLLDFGLAKLRKTGTVGAETVAEATTLSEPMTAQGTLLGTLPYMSPEQVQGKDTDGRTDLFAFGAIVYEMITGRRVFKGDNQASLIAAILDSQPTRMSTIGPMVPVGLDRVVTKCLAKDPDDRWHTAHDLRDELRWIAEQKQLLGTSADVRDDVASQGTVPLDAPTLSGGSTGRCWPHPDDHARRAVVNWAVGTGVAHGDADDVNASGRPASGSNGGYGPSCPIPGRHTFGVRVRRCRCRTAVSAGA